MLSVAPFFFWLSKSTGLVPICKCSCVVTRSYFVLSTCVLSLFITCRLPALYIFVTTSTSMCYQSWRDTTLTASETQFTDLSKPSLHSTQYYRAWWNDPQGSHDWITNYLHGQEVGQITDLTIFCWVCILWVSVSVSVSQSFGYKVKKKKKKLTCL